MLSLLLLRSPLPLSHAIKGIVYVRILSLGLSSASFATFTPLTARARGFSLV